MAEILLNMFLTAALLSAALFISKTNVALAGFVVSLPLSTLIVLALSKIQNPGTEVTSDLAKSIFIGIPSTLVFFIPFLLMDRLKLGFWTCYVSGFLLLSAGFFVHRYFVGFLVK